MKDRFKKLFGTVGAASAFALVTPMAFAAGESAAIIAEIDNYKTEALLIVMAMVLALWALRATGILKPKG